jgi:uncharacterized protein (DUF1330 family)
MTTGIRAGRRRRRPWEGRDLFKTRRRLCNADMASAKAFARSAECALVAKLRHANARSTVIIVDGM